MPTISTTIRAPDDWIDQIDSWAKDHSTTRTDAVLALSVIGMRALDGLKLDQRQLEQLLRGVRGD